MTIINDCLMLGDSICMLPAIVAASEIEPVTLYTETPAVADLLPKRFNITRAHQRTNYDGKTYIINLDRAANRVNRRIYMTAALYGEVGLPIPHDIPRPPLAIRAVEVPKVDVLLAPFSYTLPQHERWQNEKWQQLVDAFPAVRFGVLGSSNSLYRNSNFLNNVTPIFDLPLNDVAYLLHQTKALVSVVTGLQHLSFATATPTVLLTCQPPWGNNPEALQVKQDRVDAIPVDSVVNALQEIL